MRLKLVLFASLLAAILGSGASIAIIVATSSSFRPILKPGVLVLSTFVLPAIAVLLATIFVYRHTARRRKLQAILTTIIATVLTLALFIVASLIGSRTDHIQPPSPVVTPTIG